MIKRKRGRPRIGRGAAIISVSVERELLARADRLATRLHIPRAALISRALRAALVLCGDPATLPSRSRTMHRTRETS